MACSTPLSVKRPKRASLRFAGIPDARDVLAVYFWWRKQKFFAMKIDQRSQFDESSVRSVFGGDEETAPLSPFLRAGFEERTAGFDLLGVGGQFE
ncbi:uncharacterized protein BDR25DRAFT_55914 [Lindgomyces ingoldianus]|uniref:Uncharacterized protein n=1 Tax=Lindgomyces ingoldianus TaxID=673940 RepID=A0ACB6QNW9_9PLEO|nr:uncharacterized protein BDR25DRAFT_55914 [Lindgomyces ingoldianus]KAF2468570.1 hypothetical protein BDR25DRAFT_55914 [Lindgomyces ingoldianus]